MTFILFLPTWLVLGLNKEPSLTWTEFVTGVVVSLIIIILFQIYEYRPKAKIEKMSNKAWLEPLSDSKLANRRTYFYWIKVVLGFIFYLLAIYCNYPKNNGEIIVSENWQAPTLLYALLIIWVITLLLEGITYKVDRFFENRTNISKYTFRFPLLFVLIGLSALSYGLLGVDHYFKLKDSSVDIFSYEEDFKTAIGNRLCPSAFKENQKCDEPQSLVVIAASGGGIQASGWTTQVLTGLEQEIGSDFSKSIGLISSVSGGSVGTMFYLDRLNQGIIDRPEELIEDSTEDWLASVGWGLAYPDLVRVIGLPFLNLNKYLDRGYALEKDWQRTLRNPSATLDDWYIKAKNGSIPIPVFNSILIENGRRFLISPFKFVPGEMKDYLLDFNQAIKLSKSEKRSKAIDFRTLYNCGEQDTSKFCTIDITTAARLSASFPYVSPMPRNDRDNIINSSDTSQTFLQNYHMGDGGYFDNGGLFTAVEWLDRFLELNAQDLNIKKIVLLQINAFPEIQLQTQQQGEPGFITVGLGPINALNNVRDSTQTARNIQAANLLKKRWQDNNSNSINIQTYTISFPSNYNQPLSWQLSQSQKNNLKQAWENDPTIGSTIKSLKAFWHDSL